MPDSGDSGAAIGRRELLGRSRLYLVVEAAPHGRSAEALLREAIAGGVDVVQLRDKRASDEELVEAGLRFRQVCDEEGCLLILNDRPHLVAACDADGVHLGQQDGSVDEARALLGDDPLIGLSTHTPEEIDAAGSAPVDYLGVGPVYPTETKPGVPAVGEELVAYAASQARKPFFAIGAIDPERVPAVAAAGAERVAVVRAIRDSPDPRAAARSLVEALERAHHDGPGSPGGGSGVERPG